MTEPSSSSVDLEYESLCVWIGSGITDAERRSRVTQECEDAFRAGFRAAQAWARSDLEHTRQIVAAQAEVLRGFATLQNWRVAVLPIDPESMYRWVGGDFPWSVAQRTLDAADVPAASTGEENG